MTDVKKVAIALSGGIDSLVAAYILKQGYSEVFGIHFSTGYENKNFDLSSITKQLGIEIRHVDLSFIFEKEIVNYFINTYLSGKTPNPCIRCNKYIKFGALWKAAKSFGADALATGHYAKIKKDKDSYTLVQGLDIFKEQSYFLSQLSEKELKNIIFPLGDFTKETIKKMAREANLTPVEKKESQDICFLKNESIAEFIQTKADIKPIPGNIITTDGKIIGTHKGLCNFTIGQRRGINCPASEPYYVKKIDIKHNNLIVCFKTELLQKEFRVTSLNWMRKDLELPLEVSTKIRYNHKQVNSIIIKNKNDNIIDVLFEKEQFAITPGQTAVFYDNTEIIGSGIIL